MEWKELKEGLKKIGINRFEAHMEGWKEMKSVQRERDERLIKFVFT